MQIENTTVRGPLKGCSALAKVLALALLPVALAGCEHNQNGRQMAAWTLLDPAERHPILVSQQPANLNLRIASSSQGLTPAQRARVMEFVRSKAGDSGNSRLVIAAPGGSPNESAALEAADEARQLLIQAGYSETAIAMEAYHAGGGDAPLRLSYMRYVAEAPDCGQDWSQNLAANYQNTAYPNFGCAAQRNLAVMVANPADLLGPRTMTSRDSTRRDSVLSKYAKGEATGAAEENAVVSKLNTN